MKTFCLLFLMTLLSCGDDRFTKVETLEGFRIIGINATNPEVVPGGNSTLSLYVSDVGGGGRVINGTYEGCIDPGISVGAEVSCSHDPTAVSGAYVVDTTIPDLANNQFTGFSGSLAVTVPAGIFLSRSSRDQFNGVGYIVIFRFTVDGKSISAFKRIIATNRGSLNANPAGASVLLNGAVMASIPNKDDRLTVSGLTPETYSYQNIDGSTETRTEDLEVGWFVSAGKFDKPKSDYGETVKFLDDAPSTLLLVAVIRDDRGGMTVVRISL